EFKLRRLLAVRSDTVEERRRAIDAIIGVIALAPAMPGREGAVKQELVVTRIAQRMGVREETLWGRLKELRAAQQTRAGREVSENKQPAAVPPAAEERELLEVLLAEPGLVPLAAAEVECEHIQHPGLRCILQGLYRLYREGEPLSVDQLRENLNDPELDRVVLRLQEVGSINTERRGWLQQVLGQIRNRNHVMPRRQDLKNQLVAANDHEKALDLLRRLQHTT